MVAITTTSNSGEVKGSLGIGLSINDKNRWLQFLVCQVLAFKSPFPTLDFKERFCLPALTLIYSFLVAEGV